MSVKNIGITLPYSTVRQADKMRGDIPRSVFILRAIENYMEKYE
ncbi:MAG: hypothetical protein WA667_06535 [Candidatus Nitrosopolaris sp.]